MQYSEGNLGRVFVLRMDHGEDLIASLQKFVPEKKIESCMALFMGALRDGRAVTGPEVPVIPPVPHYESFESAWEVFGMATVYPSGEGPKLHIHSGSGTRPSDDRRLHPGKSGGLSYCGGGPIRVFRPEGRENLGREDGAEPALIGEAAIIENRPQSILNLFLVEKAKGLHAKKILGLWQRHIIAQFITLQAGYTPLI